MLRLQFIKPALRVLLASAFLTVMFGAGIATGFHFYPQVFAELDHDHDEHAHDDHDDHDDHAAHDEHDADHDHEEDQHVALTEQAFGNLQLTMGHATRGDYWKSILVPAQVVEIPGRSDLSVSAPIAGIVDRVHVLPGQSLRTRQPLFDIRLTDQSLTDAQSQLLVALTRQEVTQQEISRLTPLALAGAISGAKKRELEYELKRLQAQQTTLTQELRGRGLPESLIKTIHKERRMATSLTVYAPEFVQGTVASSTTGYSIEHLRVHPGKSVERGADLCSIAYHAELYIEGTAFEGDLATLSRIAENDWDISAELHEVHGGHTDRIVLDSVNLLRIDNHVDEKTQTVHFYASLKNSVTRTQHEDSRSFEQWRFRPGQRLHLRLPVERWKNQITLPTGAVVIDGPNVMVFAEHHHDGEHHDEEVQQLVESPETGQSIRLASANMDANIDSHAVTAANDDHHEDHDHEHDVFIELEPVPVRLLHRDDQTVVIANDGQIEADMEIALNNAQKLYLAMKMHADGGGGHHHHHDH